MPADLHLHTTASDGTWTPEELTQQAYYRGFSVISVTDHDSTDNVLPAIQSAPTGLSVIPGIELSTDYKGSEVHILGYFLDVTDQNLQETLVERRESRLTRAEKMVSKLNALNMPLTFDSVVKLADGAAVGRPHVAQALVTEGYVPTISAAFKQWIGKDKPAYVPHFKLTPQQAIRLILSCRGIPVLAHPGLIGNDPIIYELTESGLLGLEVLHSSHNNWQQSHYLMMCNNLDLLPTGGSDCHGPGGKDNIYLGSIHVPDRWVCQLQEYMKKHNY